jgi:hypothetical protein
VNGGRWKKATGNKPVCEELDEQNRSAQATAYPRLGEQPENTVTVAAQFSKGGRRFRANAHSLSLDTTKNNPSFIKERLTGDGKEIKPTGMCEDAKKELDRKKIVRHATRNQGNQTHSESKIVEDLFARLGPSPGGTLTLNVHWNNNGVFSDEPCARYCQDFLCAVSACFDQIFLCQDGERKNLKDTDYCK